MKKRLINQNTLYGYTPVEIPEGLTEYADRLRLLNEVPLTYLLSDISELGAESIRFGMLDINWTDALIDGAFSVGRICSFDSICDKASIAAASKSKRLSETPRMKKMHPNHKGRLRMCAENEEDYSVVSAVIIRSQLVKLMRGMSMYGCGKDGNELNILRMEELSGEILICLFHGKLDRLFIAEPKTGLAFGCSSVDWTDGKLSRSIDLRSALDSERLGDRIKSFCIDEYTEANGRLNAKALAAGMENELKSSGNLGCDKLSPSRFAFEMIAAAHRAEFCAAAEAAAGEENKSEK